MRDRLREANELLGIGRATDGIANALRERAGRRVLFGLLHEDDGVSRANRFWAIELLPAKRGQLGDLGVRCWATRGRLCLHALEQGARQRGAF